MQDSFPGIVMIEFFEYKGNLYIYLQVQKFVKKYMVFYKSKNLQNGWKIGWL